MKKYFAGFLICLSPLFAFAQQKILNKDLKQFNNKGGNWSIKGSVTANPFSDNDLQTKKGTGILTNIHEHGKYGQGYELISDFNHGDLDISFDFMMAKNSNSGVYLQGNYEVQLLDSWGKQNPTYADCGGIYHRWNDELPAGQKGYEGYAPRINAAKAPGLWQHMDISFQAPKFDKNGNKTANAVMLAIKLNNMLLHENVELSGVTRGALSKEVALGPLRFQGDHGSLAFRNIIINNFDKPAASLENLKYAVNYSSYNPKSDPYHLPIDETGDLKELTWEFLNQPNEYSYTITGDFIAPATGTYTFSQFSSSNNSLKIDGNEVLKNKYTGPNDKRVGTIELSKGQHKIEVYAAKYDAWMNPTLGLFVDGPGFRKKALHASSSMFGNKPSDPILVDAKTNTNLRSFMDFNNGEVKTRIVHAISVGTPENLHYTYDLDKGTLLQIWRGDFLDTTPMWDSRGDGSSRPRGALTLFNNDLTINNSIENWPKDTTATGYRPKGYRLDEANMPSFSYAIFGANITDKITVKDASTFLRQIRIENNTEDLAVKLGAAKSIEKVAEGLYAFNDKSWFIKISPDQKVQLVTNGDKEELIALVKNEITYEILF